MDSASPPRAVGGLPDSVHPPLRSTGSAACVIPQQGKPGTTEERRPVPQSRLSRRHYICRRSVSIDLTSFEISATVGRKRFALPESGPGADTGSTLRLIPSSLASRRNHRQATAGDYSPSLRLVCLLSGSVWAFASAGVVRLRQLKLAGPAARAAFRTIPPSLRPLADPPSSLPSLRSGERRTFRPSRRAQG